jgi:hypothetical protein
MSLYESGMNDREISDLVGVDQSAVAAWRNRLGLPANATSGGKLTPLGEEPDNRHALYQQGLTDKEIGAACRINHDSVRKWRMKHELPPNERKEVRGTHREGIRDAPRRVVNR